MAKAEQLGSRVPMTKQFDDPTVRNGGNQNDGIGIESLGHLGGEEQIAHQVGDQEPRLLQTDRPFNRIAQSG